MLLRLERGGIEPGIPGQFFMLDAPGWLLPRALSLRLAPPGELAFLIDPIGPGMAALCELEPGESIAVLGPLGNGFHLDVERPLLVGGGIGMAPLPYLAETLRFPPVVLGFRSERHAEAAVLLPGAEIAIDPTFVTDLIPNGHDVLACGPEPMLHAVAAAARRPARMGGADGLRLRRLLRLCVEIDGELERLCVEVPVLRRPANECRPLARDHARAGAVAVDPVNRHGVSLRPSIAWCSRPRDSPTSAGRKSSTPPAASTR